MVISCAQRCSDRVSNRKLFGALCVSPHTLRPASLGFAQLAVTIGRCCDMLRFAAAWSAPGENSINENVFAPSIVDLGRSSSACMSTKRALPAPCAGQVYRRSSSSPLLLRHNVHSAGCDVVTNTMLVVTSQRARFCVSVAYAKEIRRLLRRQKSRAEVPFLTIDEKCLQITFRNFSKRHSSDP